MVLRVVGVEVGLDLVLGAVLGLLCWTLLFCGLFGSFWGFGWLVVCILVLGNCCVDLRCGLDCCCGCLLCWLMPVGLLIWLVSCWFGGWF